MKDTNLTPHFKLSEFLRSTRADELGYDNTVGYNLTKLSLVADMLEKIRAKAGFPIWISSGYRCNEVNKAVKGSKTSLHLLSEAADIKACKGHSNSELFNIIKLMMKLGDIQVGLLIWEYGDSKNPAWVHVSLPRTGKPNNQILTLK